MTQIVIFDCNLKGYEIRIRKYVLPNKLCLGSGYRLDYAHVDVLRCSGEYC